MLNKVSCVLLMACAFWPPILKAVTVHTSHHFSNKLAVSRLKNGGTSADAAIEALLWQIIQPPASLLGEGLALHFDASQNKVTQFKFLAPPPELLYTKTDTQLKSEPIHQAGVPTLPLALAKIWQLHGKTQWEELFNPALKDCQNNNCPENILLQAMSLNDQKVFFESVPEFWLDVKNAQWTLTPADNRSDLVQIATATHDVWRDSKIYFANASPASDMQNFRVELEKNKKQEKYSIKKSLQKLNLFQPKAGPNYPSPGHKRPSPHVSWIKILHALVKDANGNITLLVAVLTNPQNTTKLAHGFIPNPSVLRADYYLNTKEEKQNAIKQRQRQPLPLLMGFVWNDYKINNAFLKTDNEKNNLIWIDL